MNRIAIPLVTVAALIASAVSAQPTSETAEVRAELEALQERLDRMEAEQDDGRLGDRLSFSGDLRYRHETIDDAARETRNRHRIRARFNVGAELGDDLTVGLTLATGADNPVSANQTLGDGFSRKDFGVDRAFFAWDATDRLTLRGGKMGNPLFRPASSWLIYDGDLNPEGLALSYGGEHVFANLVGFWVQERSADKDAIMTGLQGGYRTMIASADLTLGLSYYDYSNTKGYLPFWIGLPFGNSVDADGKLIYDYNLAELFGELTLDAGGQPLRLFFDYVQNTEVDTGDTGFAVGARWRRASAPGSWEVHWLYEDLEADAVIATFTDSDFAGGGTDGRGHVLRGVYVIRSNVNFTGTYFINERGEAAGNKRDYNRLQLDVNFRF